MKWIGQHIYDLVARFRNDVYLEDVQSGTIASGGNLGLDSNNKIVKATEATGDITGVALTASDGIDITSVANATGGDYAATISVDVSDFMSNGSNNRVVTALDADSMNAEQYFTWDGDDLGITSSSASKPKIEIKNTADDTRGSILSFVKDKGSGGAGDDFLGTLEFYGDNSAQEQTKFASIYVQVSEPSNTDESGKMSLNVAASNGSTSALVTGLLLEGEHNVGGEVDVTIGAEATSTTTIAGTLTMGSTATINNSGVIQVATQGTIDHDSLANFVANEHIDWTGSSAGTIHSSNIPTLNQDTTGSSASCTGQAATVATIAGLAPNTATTQATQPNIESIGTDGDTLSVLGDTLGMSNTTASKPEIVLTNQTDDATGPVISLRKQRVNSGVQDGENDDVVGEIHFWSYDDGTPTLQKYAGIKTEIHDATSGEESGKLTFQVANHDGGVGSGLILTGGSVDNEIDAVVGLGASSIVTVPGNITAAGRLTGKQIQVISANFKDNQGTTETFIPLSAQPEEKTGFGNEQVLLLMPTSGYVKEIIVRAHYSTYTSENIVYKIYNRPKNKKVNGSTQIGSDITVAAPTQNTTDDNNTRSTGDLGTTYAYNKWDMLAISMTHQSTGPASATDKTYITVVLENDLNDLGY